MSIESVMPSNHLVLCHSLILLLSIFLSIRVFSNESALCIMWPKFWTLSISISPSNEYSGLISFRIDWFDLLAVRGTLKSLLQHHSSLGVVLQHKSVLTLIWLIWILHLSTPSDWSKYHHMIQVRLAKMLWLKSLHASLRSSCHAYASVEWELCKKENKQKWWMERNRTPRSSCVYSSLKYPFDFTSTFSFFAYLGSYLASDTRNQNIST